MHAGEQTDGPWRESQAVFPRRLGVMLVNKNRAEGIPRRKRYYWICVLPMWAVVFTPQRKSTRVCLLSIHRFCCIKRTWKSRPLAVDGRPSLSCQISERSRWSFELLMLSDWWLTDQRHWRLNKIQTQQKNFRAKVWFVWLKCVYGKVTKFTVRINIGYTICNVLNGSRHYLLTSNLLNYYLLLTYLLAYLINSYFLPTYLLAYLYTYLILSYLLAYLLTHLILSYLLLNHLPTYFLHVCLLT